jgi:hypothetical protein
MSSPGQNFLSAPCTSSHPPPPLLYTSTWLRSRVSSHQALLRAQISRQFYENSLIYERLTHVQPGLKGNVNHLDTVPRDLLRFNRAQQQRRERSRREEQIQQENSLYWRRINEAKLISANQLKIEQSKHRNRPNADPQEQNQRLNDYIQRLINETLGNSTEISDKPTEISSNIPNKREKPPKSVGDSKEHSESLELDESLGELDAALSEISVSKAHNSSLALDLPELDWEIHENLEELAETENNRMEISQTTPAMPIIKQKPKGLVAPVFKAPKVSHSSVNPGLKSYLARPKINKLALNQLRKVNSGPVLPLPVEKKLSKVQKLEILALSSNNWKNNHRKNDSMVEIDASALSDTEEISPQPRELSLPLNANAGDILFNVTKIPKLFPLINSPAKQNSNNNNNGGGEEKEASEESAENQHAVVLDNNRTQLGSKNGAALALLSADKPQNSLSYKDLREFLALQADSKPRIINNDRKSPSNHKNHSKKAQRQRREPIYSLSAVNLHHFTQQQSSSALSACLSVAELQTLLKPS